MILKYIQYFVLVCVLTCSQMVFAVEEAEHRYTAKERITFSPATKRAFDRSGKTITHSTRADGSSSSEHNGSMGNVTVARMGPDGTVETYCTSDEPAARAWMAGEFGWSPAVSPSAQVKVK
jgi:hypothetical protein